MSSILAPPPPPPPPPALAPIPPPMLTIVTTKKVSPDSRSALLSDISKGVQLKKCIPNQGRNVQFSDGNNNDNGNDPSVSGLKGIDEVKRGPFPSALHAELTNTLKKRKTSKVAPEDGEIPKEMVGIRTFDPNILNTHVPQPTGLKITHASPNFNVRKVNTIIAKKGVEERSPKGFSSPRSLSSKESSPDRPVMKTVTFIHSPKPTGVDTVDHAHIITPSVKELKKQLSVTSQTEDVKKVDKKIQKLDVKFGGSHADEWSRTSKSSSPEVKPMLRSEEAATTSPTIKELKKQLSVASQTDDVKKVDRKVQKLDIPINAPHSNGPKSPLKSPKKAPTRPTVLRVTSTDANGTKKIRHPGANFTLPRKSDNNGKLKSPVKTHPSSPLKPKSFQKENITTFNKPTLASLQRQNSNPPQKKGDHVIKGSNDIPTNYDKRSQVSFSKELSNAKNHFQENVKTTRKVVTKTDLYFNNVNLANVKLEINTDEANVIKVVPK